MAEVQSEIPAESEALQRIMDDIDALGLTDNVLDVEVHGFTKISKAISEDQVERARAAIVARVESDTGRKVDVERETGEGWEGMTYVPYMLFEDAVFEEILMAPKPLALITYLLGESCLLSSMGCHFKRPGGAPLPLHSDNGNGIPVPFSPVSQVANVNYALTQYSRDAGALALVPGSHKLARRPRPEEMLLGGEDSNPRAIPMDLAPGDAVVWHGNTWHGSFARTIPGVRMNLAVYFNRQYIQTPTTSASAPSSEASNRTGGRGKGRIIRSSP
jgi:ectoine hydroxylase-related dioxygenase (phytanoyl-CoA dioxygenase family)